MSAERVLVCVPTYNERENLTTTAGRLLAAAPEIDLLVVDDNSPDGTGDLAEELAGRDARVHVLHRTEKAGLGAAYVAGFRWGLERGYDVLVEMDADGSHQPEELPRLLAALHDADLVVGSRYVTGGDVRNWPWSRLLLSRGGNAYIRLALGMPVADATAGFRAYRARVLRTLPLAEVASQGYCFQVDLAWQAWRAGFRVVEVPITFVERELGASKMSRAIVAEALWRPAWWALKSRRRGPAAQVPPLSVVRDAPPGTTAAEAGPGPPTGEAASGPRATGSVPRTGEAAGPGPRATGPGASPASARQAPPPEPRRAAAPEPEAADRAS